MHSLCDFRLLLPCLRYFTMSNSRKDRSFVREIRASWKSLRFRLEWIINSWALIAAILISCIIELSNVPSFPCIIMIPSWIRFAKLESSGKFPSKDSILHVEVFQKIGISSLDFQIIFIITLNNQRKIIMFLNNVSLMESNFCLKKCVIT